MQGRAAGGGRGAPGAQQQQQQQQHDSRWLCSLQLTAVHPAALRAHPDTLLQQPHQQHQHQQQPQHEQGGLAVAPAAAAPHHHELLVHLEAVVVHATARPPGDAPELPAAAAAAAEEERDALQPAAASAADDEAQLLAHSSSMNDADSCSPASCSLLPLHVDEGMLQLVLLNREMQVLLHKQCSLLHLLRQQQLLAPAPRLGAAVVHTRQVLQLNVQLSAPCYPSPRVLDALHLLITLSGASLNDAAAPATTAAGQQQPAACLVAEVPLLVLPALAQAEVQQLLLPAMRQDVQVELQQQAVAVAGPSSEQQQQQQVVDPAALAWQSMQVERTAWRHFNQLTLDMLLIMQLSEAARAEAAAAVMEGAPAAAEAAEPAVQAAAAASPSSAVANAPPPAPATARQQQQLLPAMARLMQAAQTLLLPLLLPFLTAHGLRATLEVLLQCLPPELQVQQQWQQQEAARVQQLAVLTPPTGPTAPAEQVGGTTGPGTGGSGSSGAPPQAAAPAVVVSSAVLDTATAAGHTPAPAASELHTSPHTSGASDVFESGKSSPEADWGDAVDWGVGWHLHTPWQQQEQQEMATLRPRPAQDAAASSSSSSSSCSSAAQAAGAAAAVDGSGPGAARAAAADASRGGSSSEPGSAAFAPRPVSSISVPGSSRTASALPLSEPAAAGASASVQAGGGSSSASSAGSVSSSVSGPGSRSSSSTTSSMAWRLLFGSSSSSSIDEIEAATGVPCWRLPLQQFADIGMERRYLAWKHEQLLYLDLIGGLYTLGIAAALLKQLQHPATLLLVALTLTHALPHVPLLLGYRQQHIRFRELWVFLAAPASCLVLLLGALTSSAWRPMAAMPAMPLAYRSFWRMHGELLTAALRAFFHHMRLRPFVLATVVDRVVSMLVWALWTGLVTAAAHSTCAGVVSIVACWALEVCMRRRFVLQAGSGGRRPGSSGGSSGSGGGGARARARQ